MAFKATFYNGTSIDLSSDGTQLSIVDYSNYDGNYTDQATGGGATTIIFPTGASTFNDFYKNLEVNIVAGQGVGQGGIITGYVGGTLTATVATTFNPVPNATSVFQVGERGHLQKYFADFKKIYIYAPSETWLISTLGDGDDTTPTPDGATLPITDTYTFSDGDAVYHVIMYVLPTYSATTAYLYVNRPCVYYGGKMYKLLQNGTNKQPDIEPTYWEEVTDITDLAARYIADNYVVSYCDLMECWRNKVAAAVQPCNSCNTELLIRNLDVQRAFQISLLKEAIPVLAAKGWWTSSDNPTSNVTDTLNFAKTICCQCQ